MNNELRSFIIEYSVLIEELISKTLGALLNVDYKESKSLGFGSTSLSFSQKALIIQDVKGFESIDSKKIRYFTYIRNKFAHVREIETFDDLFRNTSNGNEIKKYFDKVILSLQLSEEVNDHYANSENLYKFCFAALCNELVDLFIKISLEHEFNRGYEAGKVATDKELLSWLIDELVKFKDGKEILSKMFISFKNGIE